MQDDRIRERAAATGFSSMSDTVPAAATPDRIEREIVVQPPIERVWAVLTQPQHIAEQLVT